MAIQFFCSGCGQPIEVDDNLANLAVTCPYCRKVVTTPAATTLAAAPTVPVTPFSPAAVPEPPPYAAVAASRKKAVLGWIAFACALLMIAFSSYTLQAFGSLTQGLNLQPKGQQETEDFKKTLKERAQDSPGLQIGVCAGWGFFPLAAVVCGIIGLVRREQPRWPAIASLVLFGLAIALNCMGLMRIAAASGGGA